MFDDTKKLLFTHSYKGVELKERLEKIKSSSVYELPSKLPADAEQYFPDEVNDAKETIEQKLIREWDKQLKRKRNPFRFTNETKLNKLEQLTKVYVSRPLTAAQKSFHAAKSCSMKKIAKTMLYMKLVTIAAYGGYKGMLYFQEIYAQRKETHDKEQLVLKQYQKERESKVDIVEYLQSRKNK